MRRRVVQQVPDVELSLRLSRPREAAPECPEDECRSVVEHLAGWADDQYSLGGSSTEIPAPDLVPDLLELDGSLDWANVLVGVALIGSLCEDSTVDWAMASAHEGIWHRWYQVSDRAVNGVIRPQGIGGYWEIVATVTDPDGETQQVSFLLVTPDSY